MQPCSTVIWLFLSCSEAALWCLLIIIYLWVLPSAYAEPWECPSFTNQERREQKKRGRVLPWIYLERRLNKSGLPPIRWADIRCVQSARFPTDVTSSHVHVHMQINECEWQHATPFWPASPSGAGSETPWPISVSILLVTFAPAGPFSCVRTEYIDCDVNIDTERCTVKVPMFTTTC